MPNLAYSPGTALSRLQAPAPEDAAVGLLLRGEELPEPADQVVLALVPGGEAALNQCDRQEPARAEARVLSGLRERRPVVVPKEVRVHEGEPVLCRRQSVLVSALPGELVEAEHHAGVPRDVVVLGDGVVLAVVAVGVEPARPHAALEPAERLGDCAACGGGRERRADLGRHDHDAERERPEREDGGVEQQASHREEATRPSAGAGEAVPPARIELAHAV